MLEALRAKYEPQGVTFLRSIRISATRERPSLQAAAGGLEALPILMDETQLVGESLDLTRNGEVLVLDPKGWKVAYRGAASRRCGRRRSTR